MSDGEVDMVDAASDAGSDAESGISSAKGTKKVAASKSKAKAPPKEKKSPGKKRKDADGEKPAAKKAKAAPAAAAAAAASSSDDPKDIVRNYMLQQNRPYTTLVVYENLHQRIKKPALQRIMDELTEEGALQAKDFKKVRVYLAKQGDEAAADPAELEQLEAKSVETRAALAEVRATNKRLDDQIRSLQSEMSDEQLADENKTLTKQVDALNARLARIKGDGKQVDKAAMQRVQSHFNDMCTAWIKRKKAAMDMMSDMAGDEGEIKDVITLLGVETDEEADVKLSEWRNLIKDEKKK